MTVTNEPLAPAVGKGHPHHMDSPIANNGRHEPVAWAGPECAVGDHRRPLCARGLFGSVQVASRPESTVRRHSTRPPVVVENSSPCRVPSLHRKRAEQYDADTHRHLGAMRYDRTCVPHGRHGAMRLFQLVDAHDLAWR